MILAGIIGLLVGAIIGGIAAKTKVFESAKAIVRATSTGFKDFSGAETDDERQRLSMKLGTLLIVAGLKALAIFAAALFVFVAPIWFGTAMASQQVIYVFTSAVGGAIAFGKFGRVAS